MQFGGQTPLKLAGAARARRREACSAPPPTPSTAPKTASGSTSCSTKLQLRRPRGGIAHGVQRGVRSRRAHRLSRCWCARATCSAAAPWRSCTRAATSRATCATRSRRLEDAETHDHPGRRVPQGRDRGRRRLRLRRQARGHRRRACSTSKRPACTRATRRACCRRTRCRPRCSAPIDASTRALALELGVIGLMNVQFAVQRQRRLRASRSIRARRARCPSCRKAIGVPLAKIAAKVHGRQDARGARLHRGSRCRRTSR